jgi:hypothetical protein
VVVQVAVETPGVFSTRALLLQSDVTPSRKSTSPVGVIDDPVIVATNVTLWLNTEEESVEMTLIFEITAADAGEAVAVTNIVATSAGTSRTARNRGRVRGMQSLEPGERGHTKSRSATVCPRNVVKSGGQREEGTRSKVESVRRNISGCDDAWQCGYECVAKLPEREPCLRAV